MSFPHSFLIALGIFLGIGVLWFWLLFTRANTLLRGWASESGYQVVNKTHIFFRLWKLPLAWWFTTGRAQVIYHVVVEDSAGTRRSGWVRLGHWFWGTLANGVEVRWEE